MCQHLRRIGDNYGETCLDCGEVLAGFGYWAEGSSRCVRHVFMPDGADGEVCIFCEEWRPSCEAENDNGGMST